MTRLDAAVGYCHPGVVEAEFADSMFAMLQRYQVAARIGMHTGPRIASARNNICRAFLKQTDAQWLWMVDSDMVFASDTLARLIATASDKAPIVGALCFGLDDDGEVFPVIYEDIEGRPVRTRSYKEGCLQPAAATGAACLLIHRDVLLKLGDVHKVQPWFQETVEGDWEYGEDVTFCIRAREAGFPIHVHTGIKVGHKKHRIVTAADYWEGARDGRAYSG